MARLDPGHYRSGSANTNRLLPALGRISGVRRINPDAVAALPVLTATYCRPSTAKLIGKPLTGEHDFLIDNNGPLKGRFLVPLVAQCYQ